jgi:predicted amidohydrolase
MIEPYQAVGLIQTMRGIRRRDEIAVNLDHISHMIKAASWLSSMDLPVRLICIPEGGLQGFTDEVFDLDHETYARECAIDIPGPETDYLGRLAQQWNAFVVAQAKARHPEFPGLFFNVGFVIEPEDGTVILKHHKLVPLLPVEHSVTPHNVWDRWIELYGRDLKAFYPVADTEIGRIGIMMANEASYPENARGLAMGGCEIAYRGPYPAPGVMSGMFSVQNRARALDNNIISSPDLAVGCVGCGFRPSRRRRFISSGVDSALAAELSPEGEATWRGRCAPSDPQLTRSWPPRISPIVSCCRMGGRRGRCSGPMVGRSSQRRGSCGICIGSSARRTRCAPMRMI